MVVTSIVALYILAGIVLRFLIWVEIRRIAGEGSPVSVAQLALAVPQDAENGAQLYEKAFRLTSPTRKFTNLHHVSRDPARIKGPILWNQLNAEAAEFVSVVEATREAASMPHCRFKQDSERYLTPANPKVRSLAGLLNGYALVLAHKGDSGAAMRVLRLALSVADSIKGNPGVVTFLVRAGIYARTGDSAYRIVSRGSVSEEEVRALSDALARDDLERDIVAMLKGTRALYNSAFDRIARDGVPPEGVLTMDQASPWIRFECCCVGRPVLRLDQLRFLRAMRRVIRDAHIPFRKLPKPRPSRDRLECPCRSWAWSFSDGFVVDWYRWREIFDCNRARIDGTRLAIAACVYRNRFGAYPQSLSDLAKLGWKLEMEDPFSGRDFVYRRQADGFLLYSIASDLKDDGGKVDPQYPTPREGFDMVWTTAR